MKKRRLLIFIVLTLIFPKIVYSEENNDPMGGVKMFSSPEGETESEMVLSLNDIKMSDEIEIDDFENIKFTFFEIEDQVRQYKGSSIKTYKSGKEAEYACLYFDVLNTTKKPKDYNADVHVRAIYDNDYEYEGWSFQIDYDASADAFIPHDHERMFSIDPMYTGHYVVGATLPNAVIDGKEQLKIVMDLDGNEMTYYVRK